MDLRLYNVTEFSKLKNFFKKLMGQESFSIPKKIERQFNAQFKNALNPEWNENSEYFEALFHLDNVEKIARYNRDGKRMELRTNCTPEELPGETLKKAHQFGEIMNAIHIEQENNSLFEIIIRNKDLTRILILIDDKNDLLKEAIL
jgi:hypothetical protein